MTTPAATRPDLSTQAAAALVAFFDGMTGDLEIGVAAALADKLRTSPAVIFRAFEAWQIAPATEEAAAQSAASARLD